MAVMLTDVTVRVPNRTGTYAPQRTHPAEAEVARLQALVVKLQAERDALQWAASHDDLTGLPNRRSFTALAPSFLDGRSTVVFVLDLNGFKPVNDRFGHDAGDTVLCLVGQRLAFWAGDNLVARFGGDEFAGILTSPETDPQWWSPAIAKLATALAEPMPVAGQIITVAASIGVIPAQGRAAISDLLRQADLAMYQAKRQMRATGCSDSAWVCGPAPSDELEVLQMEPSRTEQQMSAKPVPPACEPGERDAGSVAPASSYRSGDPVWIHRSGAWRPGVVQTASERAVLARYYYAEGIGTTVDTVWAEYVAARHASPRS